MSRPRAALLATLALLALAALVPRLPAGAWRHAGHLLFVTLLLVIPLGPTLRGQARPDSVGFPVPGLRDLLPGLVASLVLLPLFHLAVSRGLWPSPPAGLRVPPSAMLSFSLIHMLEVVLPEEIFFRGYLQPAWAGARGPQLLGIRWHAGVWLQALAFGLVHVAAYGTPAAMDRALPGVAFGYLRERTGNVWSSAVLHLACNLYVFGR